MSPSVLAGRFAMITRHAKHQRCRAASRHQGQNAHLQSSTRQIGLCRRRPNCTGSGTECPVLRCAGRTKCVAEARQPDMAQAWKTEQSGICTAAHTARSNIGKAFSSGRQLTHVKDVTAGGAAKLRLPVTAPPFDACTANSRVPGPEPAEHPTTLSCRHAMPIITDALLHLLGHGH